MGALACLIALFTLVTYSAVTFFGFAVMPVLVVSSCLTVIVLTLMAA